MRQADGKLVVIGRRPSAFDAEQWLRADADARDAKAAIDKDKCDKLGCVAHLADGRAVAVDLDRAAFAEDCAQRRRGGDAALRAVRLQGEVWCWIASRCGAREP